MSYAADPAKREAILTAQQARLDWLRDNPDVPVMDYGNDLMFCASRDEVTAVAALSGGETGERNGAYRVVVQFGADVTYVAWASDVPETVTAEAGAA